MSRTRSRSTAVTAALALLLAAPLMLSAQRPPYPATPEPPDIAELRQRPAPPPAPGRPETVDELLAKVGLNRAEIERRKAAGGPPAHAATAEPPDVAELRGRSAPPALGRSPTFQELIDQISRRPEGVGLLDEARRGGAGRLGGRGSGSGALRPDSHGGPRVDFADDDTPNSAIEMRVTRAAPYVNVAGLGTLSVADRFVEYSNSNTTWGPLYVYSTTNWAFGGGLDVKPYLYASVNVTTAGWYLLNFVATRTRANLHKYVYPMQNNTSYPVLTSWDNTTQTVSYPSYPYVVNLAAGYHTFYFVPTQQYYSSFVQEVYVTKL